MKFCSLCGEPVEQLIPAGDNRRRYVCSSCEHIHYQNPKVIVGTLPLYEGKVLLCKRAIEPRKGYWTLPAGFMENQETSLQGALRESLEEAGATVINPAFYRLFDLPHISQVYVFYRGELQDGHYEPGAESSEVALFSEEQIPWDELAFPVVTELLREYFVDRQSGVYPVRSSSIERLIPKA
ncbi:NUDIX hydrolase [Dasania sp. GY-MA-18]|uniref:NUDIX hydrolase n=1 Tax=Dasania phycosphaerae TaxID=2950436 RepID=A0A9J6RKZ3_9GAMM|nr:MULTISPECIES: NUDIX hydrolase [Dasania]MCR8922572.1 NUDIX hydrolase [Dasania sp. GY-MA-18]MCZ0865001.1 NUDIX hydrolase [Dasania phycosphaerae]MCZ0868728.1 NUDIX hydrolase [Dasania phycosphaerae]